MLGPPFVIYRGIGLSAGFSLLIRTCLGMWSVLQRELHFSAQYQGHWYSFSSWCTSLCLSFSNPFFPLPSGKKPSNLAESIIYMALFCIFFYKGLIKKQLIASLPPPHSSIFGAAVHCNCLARVSRGHACFALSPQFGHSLLPIVVGAAPPLPLMCFFFPKRPSVLGSNG